MVILPKTYVDPRTLPADMPLFFFAGPILGGGDWQFEMHREFEKRLRKFLAVVPCRYPKSHLLVSCNMEGERENIFQGKRQTTWERFYLAAAAERRPGCILFWLPCESKEEPRTDGNPYARDSYGEIGEWRGRMMRNPSLRVVVGAEAGFPGLSVIQQNFNDALGREFPIYESLEELRDRAIEMAFR